jgi:hypothetical protein
MKNCTLLIAAFAFIAAGLASCNTPPPTPYDRPLKSWKAQTGGVNPSSKGHHHNKK